MSQLNAIKSMSVYLTGDKIVHIQDPNQTKVTLSGDVVENCKVLMDEMKAVING